MRSKVVLLLLCLTVVPGEFQFASFKNLKSYVKLFNLRGFLGNETDNELWQGLFRDCSKKVTFSCIQKNAYSYLDSVLIERDNITVFDGLTLTKNNLDYGTCSKRSDRDNLDENLVEDSGKSNCEEPEEDINEGVDEDGRRIDDQKTPIEEVTDALRKRTVKFLATRDYKIQLPQFFFEGATMKISPREVDENGALLRLDIGETSMSQGRIFKKIRKFIQNKLLSSLLVLLLIAKLIKIKFLVIVPFLFGVGTAKKLFLKLLLFFIPAFAHVFKLCSSYYTAHSTKYHHHHHQVAHHHHHVPVPIAVPTYYDHHHHHHDEEFDGYDYAHPHIQYRKDVEELKEWGITPNEEPYDESSPHVASSLPPRGVVPAPLPGPQYPGSYGLQQYAPNARPIVSNYPEKRPVGISPHNMAYSGYLDEKYNNRRVLVQQPNAPVASVPANPTNIAANLQAAANLQNVANLHAANSKNPYTVTVGQQNTRIHQGQRNQQSGSSKSPIVQRQAYEDDYYGPIVAKLDGIFGQLRFYEESCRERLVCSMYKSPAIYSPHSNLVSNELSRDPQELKRGAVETASSQKFMRYLNAARLGQEKGDCLNAYPCPINTE